MASSSSFSPDDQTDADFFDKLVDDDDPATDLPRTVSATSLADDPPVPEPAPAPPEGSGKGGAGVHTAVKQVQWASFGGGADDGPDPFADLSGGAGDDDGFLGSTAGTQTASDHAFFGGSQSLAAEVTDQDFFAGTSSSSDQQNVNGQYDQGSGTSTAVDSADPKSWEAMYPGWKYHEASQQWYQLDDSVNSTGNAAQVLDNSTQNAQQQQQQLDASYLLNSAHAGLETIAEEGTTAAGAVSSWGQGAASEYPPNMLFYAEYPGWYFDTNTQQWHSLESNQQAAMQAGTASTGQTVVANDGVVATSSSLTGYNAGQTEDLAAHNQVTQHSSFSNSFTQQNQWQTTDAFGNNVRSESATDNSLASSFYGFEQHRNDETTSSSTSQQAGFNTAETATDHYGGRRGFESSSIQNGYSSSDSQQSSYKAFEPSTGYQAGYKAFQPAAGHHTSTNMFEQSTEGYKAFEPAMNNQSGYKAFEPSMGHHSASQGFMPSTGHQTDFRGSRASTVHQAGYKEFETSTGYNTSFKAFEPSSQHAGFMGSQPSSGHQPNYMGFDTSANHHGYGDANGVASTQGFVPMQTTYHGQKQAIANSQGHLSNSYLGTDNSMNFNQQQFLGANASNLQFGHSPHEGRSSAGRPRHALVAFGFGGKLIVMKETSSMPAGFNTGNQGNPSSTVSVLNLLEVVIDKVDPSSITNGSALSYFHALCRQPVPGPLVGGSAASKDVNKWLDEMIAWYESSSSEFQRGDTRKLLISLLKILSQHYGKLRSPFASDPLQEETDGPEMAVTKLFSSCKRSTVHMGDYGSIVPCMKNIASESQMQAVAQEVQSLLVSGRRKEALQCAQGGQLWGPAIILALQLGDQFYVDTVKKMAHFHFVSGSPLRTLCLLIAGQPADVFNVENNVNSDYGTSHQPLEPGPNGMLDDWEENLAIITANRTKGDDLVITHLGDCLWKEKNEVAAAHSCYLVAELNIDSYSESARLCLIGADHLKCPRTFASPEAIQRTEVYEYAKVLGNSQYILLPFQPYKLIYAYMLVEVGKVSDSLRYCQASMKVLKASGRAPELEVWKQLFSSLEERIRTHQQGGYGTNLAPTKLVGKIFTSLDKSISRMMGTPSAPLPPLPHGSVSDRESHSMPAAAKFVNSQSVMAMSSLMPSASMQSMTEIAENSGGTGRTIAHNRSVSEPDFGRTSKQGAGSDGTQSSASGSGSSRFGWLVQKTMGLVSKSHCQAKLGDQNKFYYDAKLKRWVEEGAAVPAEEPPLPPPPTKPSFQNGMPDHKLNGPMSVSHAPNGVTEWKSSNSSEQGGLGMPPIPPSQNQFSARGRMGVRSRYVDTFNKSGVSGAVPSYNKPAAPSVTPPAGAKFFMPTAAPAAADQMMPHQAAEIHSETIHQDERSASPPAETSFSSTPPPTQFSSPPPHTQFSSPMQSTIHWQSSMDNISTPYQGSGVSSLSNNSSFSKSRAASWSGTYSDQFSAFAGTRSPDVQTMPSPLMPGKPSHSRSNSNSSVQLNGLTEDLHEVEL
ncbi:protein transport protein SEC16A homolog isoform X2 [Miscanthus floridulus]|uniref:protein transport protein SEC16A homolog isoform X2 n=1 Tax=Miscanthus floridulus TaxID=154761 RepID=UPI00345814AD